MVQKTTVSKDYVNLVVKEGKGKLAMKLASEVAAKVFVGESGDFLQDINLEDNNNKDVTEFLHIARDLHKYVTEKRELLQINEPSRERVMRQQSFDKFTVDDAVKIVDLYTDSLWEAVEKRLQYAGLDDQSSCAYSEAPAEGVFSVYGRVTQGRERMTLSHALSLTRVSMHGPPPSTPEAAELAGEALRHYKSRLGERFCTLLWFKGKTSTTISKLKQAPWKWD